MKNNNAASAIKTIMGILIAFLVISCFIGVAVCLYSLSASELHGIGILIALIIIVITVISILILYGFIGGYSELINCTYNTYLQLKENNEELKNVNKLLAEQINKQNEQIAKQNELLSRNFLTVSKENIEESKKIGKKENHDETASTLIKTNEPTKANAKLENLSEDEKSKIYYQGLNNLWRENYKESIFDFKKLGDYKDSQDKLMEAKYKYCKYLNNYSETDVETYLNELINANYSGAQDLYNKLKK